MNSIHFRNRETQLRLTDKMAHFEQTKRLVTLRLRMGIDESNANLSND